MPNKTSKFLWLLFAVFVFFRLELFVQPLGYDQTIYAYIGQQANAGQMLYRDVSDNKPPVIFVVNQVYLKIAEFLHLDKTLTILLLDSLAAWLAILLFIQLALLFTKAWQFPSLAFVIFTNAHKISQGGLLTEHYLLLFLMGALYFIICKKPKYLLAGLFFGLGFLAKQVALFSLAGVLVYQIFYKKNFKSILYLGLGFVLVQLVVCGIFYVQGNLPDYIYDSFIYLKTYQAVLPASAFFKNLALSVYDLLLSVGFIWLGLVCWSKQTKNKKYYLLLLILGFELIGIASSKRFFGHYYLQSAATICLLLTGLDFKKIDNYWKNIIYSLIILAFIVQGLFLVRAIVRSDNSFRLAGEYVRENTTARDVLFADGETVRVAFYADRAHFYKMVYTAYKFNPESRARMRLIYNRNKPKFFLVYKEADLEPLKNYDSQIAADLINYTYVKQFGDIRIYQRLIK